MRYPIQCGLCGTVVAVSTTFPVPAADNVRCKECFSCERRLADFLGIMEEDQTIYHIFFNEENDKREKNAAYDRGIVCANIYYLEQNISEQARLKRREEYMKSLDKDHPDSLLSLLTVEDSDDK